MPEVLDSWIEAGSASFGERHFPFNKKWKLEEFFPPDFVIEYTGQIRAWFYVLHVIGGALYDSPAFKNVGVTGVVLGTDGRKMSKNLGNYPDPKEMLEKYGGDALRLYMLGSPVMHGEDFAISEEGYRNQVKGTMLILWNVYNFFITYANIDKWEPKGTEYTHENSQNVLDKWIVSLLNQLGKDVTESFEKYDTVNAITAVQQFVSDFSTWYIRRSRDRVGPSAPDETDKKAFYETTYQVLVKLCKIIAPITPFLAEAIYRNLTDEESVHLTDWPVFHEKLIDRKLDASMSNARELASMILMRRKVNNVKVRLPLKKISYKGPEELSEPIKKVVMDEVNVYDLVYAGENSMFEAGGTDADELLNQENQDLKAGEARDIVRKIQEERKKLGTTIDEKVHVTLESFPEDFADYIKRNALVETLSLGESFSVARA